MLLAILSKLMRQADEVPTIVRDENPAHSGCTTELIAVGEAAWWQLDCRHDGEAPLAQRSGNR